MGKQLTTVPLKPLMAAGSLAPVDATCGVNFIKNSAGEHLIGSGGGTGCWHHVGLTTAVRVTNKLRVVVLVVPSRKTTKLEKGWQAPVSRKCACILFAVFVGVVSMFCVLNFFTQSNVWQSMTNRANHTHN